jgi:Putative FMN-binding domain
MLDRVEYAMASMQEVRRLIRHHGWAVLVAGGSGDLRATHVPCLLDPARDPGGAAGPAAQDPGPRDRRAPSGRPVPERPARRRDATRPQASTRPASPTKEQIGAPVERARDDV